MAINRKSIVKPNVAPLRDLNSAAEVLMRGVGASLEEHDEGWAIRRNAPHTDKGSVAEYLVRGSWSRTEVECFEVDHEVEARLVWLEYQHSQWHGEEVPGEDECYNEVCRLIEGISRHLNADPPPPATRSNKGIPTIPRSPDKRETVPSEDPSVASVYKSNGVIRVRWLDANRHHHCVHVDRSKVKYCVESGDPGKPDIYLHLWEQPNPAICSD